jgi:hypothetical protein
MSKRIWLDAVKTFICNICNFKGTAVTRRSQELYLQHMSRRISLEAVKTFICNICDFKGNGRD